MRNDWELLLLQTLQKPEGFKAKYIPGFEPQ